jgi:hypothetical protein
MTQQLPATGRFYHQGLKNVGSQARCGEKDEDLPLLTAPGVLGRILMVSKVTGSRMRAN